MALAEIDGGVLRRFLDHPCACEHPQFYGRPPAFSGGRRGEARLAQWAGFLIDRGQVADWRDPVPNENRGARLDAFLGWLRQHRGVRDTTLLWWRGCARASPGKGDAMS